MKPLIKLLCWTALAAVFIAAPAAPAQNYPTRAIRIIAPFAPGGGSDFIARLAAKKLGERLNMQMIVDNRPGAGGILGSELAIKAPPDGYTLLLVAGSYTVNPALYKLTFDPVNDIVPIVELSEEPFVFAVHPSLQVKTLGELIAMARAQPDKLTYASAGSGSITHLATELFLDMAKIKITHVPYKGTGPAVSDTVAGNVQFIVGSMAATLPQVKAGRLRGLAVSTSQRLAAAPELPTVAEAGVPGYSLVLWHGLVAPKGTARPIIEHLNRETNAVMRDADTRELLAKDGISPGGGTPEQFAAEIRSDIERWARIVKQANVHVD